MTTPKRLEASHESTTVGGGIYTHGPKCQGREECVDSSGRPASTVCEAAGDLEAVVVVGQVVVD